MKGKNLIILAAVAAVLAGIAIWTTREQAEPAPESVGKRVFPELPVNEVRNITLVGADSTATVARISDKWVAPDRYDYPADFEKVRNALIKLADLEVAQVMRVDDEQRRTLKMVSPVGCPTNRTGETGTLVRLFDEAGAELADLLIGATHREAMGDRAASFRGYTSAQYVSPDRGRTVYLVTDTFYDFDTDPKDWLDKELLDVKSSEMESITLRHPSRDKIRLARGEDDGGLRVEGLSEEQETDTSTASSLASALSYLRFLDVADPALPDEQTGMDEPFVYEAVTKSGKIYTVAVGGSPAAKDDRYMRISAAMQERKPALETTTDDAGEEAGSEEDAAQKEEEAKKREEERQKAESEVAELNRKTAGWTYLISSYKADAMIPTLDQLINEKEEEQPEQQAEEDHAGPEADEAQQSDKVEEITQGSEEEEEPKPQTPDQKQDPLPEPAEKHDAPPVPHTADEPRSAGTEPDTGGPDDGPAKE